MEFLGLSSFAEPLDSVKDSCALVLEFDGVPKVLDSSRNSLKQVEKGLSIPCGGWISTDRKAWVKLQYTQGYQVHLAPGSFARIQPEGAQERLILGQGQAYLVAKEGLPPFLGATHHARVRLVHGSGILIRDSKNEKSTWMTLEGLASFENRYLSAKRIQVQARSMTELGLKPFERAPSQLRPIPAEVLKARSVALRIHFERKGESAKEQSVLEDRQGSEQTEKKRLMQELEILKEDGAV